MRKVFFSIFMLMGMLFGCTGMFFLLSSEAAKVVNIFPPLLSGVVKDGFPLESGWIISILLGSCFFLLLAAAIIDGWPEITKNFDP